MVVKIIVGAVLFFAVALAQDSIEISNRLSNTTEPVSYELWLETKIHERIFDYTGRVKIALKALEATNSIMLSSEGLLFYNQTLRDLMDNNMKINIAEVNENLGFIIFSMEENLRIDEIYILDIHFAGSLHRIPDGFCYSSYMDEHGETLYLATSHMHVTNARKVFPCYNEPRYRTPFTIHISHHPTLHAVSNMPVAQVVNNSEDSATTTFERTFPMPVNLLAFTISKHAVQTRFFESMNLSVNIFVPKQHLDEVNFALDYMKFCMEKLRDFVNMDIQLPKLDSITINDLLLTGLENWGLIFFNPKNFLYKENVTSPGQRMDIVRTITHQLAHNYFGSIVGITWWNFFWMTEGFATYFEYYFGNEYLPDYPLNDMFCADFTQRNLADHSLLMSPALNKYIDDPNDVTVAYGVFDFAMVSKAASMMRMIHHLLGTETFRKGLRKYVKEMQYEAADAKDLCRSLQEAADEDHALPEDISVEDVISSWTDQPGYPLLTVMRNYESNEIVVNQQRFLSARDEFDLDGLSWYIPLTMATATNPDMDNTKPWAWLKKGIRELVLTMTDNKTWAAEDWIIFNVQETGYYRVNYDTQNWRLLASELHQGPPFSIGTLNRAQIIDDSCNLAYSDVIPFTLALDIIKYVRFEPDYAVWLSASRHLLSLNSRLEGPSYALFFGRFLQHLTEDHFEKLDVFENANGKDTVRNTFLRPIIVDLACRSGSGKCLTATRIMVTAEALTGHILAPHEKPSVYYCHGLKSADEKTFRYFWNKLKTITNEQERSHISSSIGCYKDFQALYTLFLELVSPEFYHLYTALERFQIIINAARYGNGPVVLEFLKYNHEDISKIFTFNNRMEQTLREIGDNILDDDIPLFQEVIDILFNASHITSDQVIRLKINLDYHRTWINENKNTIEEWIREYFEPISGTAVGKIAPIAAIIIGITLHVIANILVR